MYSGTPEVEVEATYIILKRKNTQRPPPSPPIEARTPRTPNPKPQKSKSPPIPTNHDTKTHLYALSEPRINPARVVKRPLVQSHDDNCKSNLTFAYINIKH
jgi:hypothetical protein